MSDSPPPIKNPPTRRFTTADGGIHLERREERIQRIVRRLRFEQELHECTLSSLEARTKGINPDTIEEAHVLDLIGFIELDLAAIDEALKALEEIGEYYE